MKRPPVFSVIVAIACAVCVVLQFKAGDMLNAAGWTIAGLVWTGEAILRWNKYLAAQRQRKSALAAVKDPRSGGL